MTSGVGRVAATVHLQAPSSGGPGRGDGVGEVRDGDGRWPWPVGRSGSWRPVELVSVDSMAVYRGMDIGTAKPTPGRGTSCPTTWSTWSIRRRSSPSSSSNGRRATRWPASPNADHRALLVGGTGLYLRSVVDDLAFPGRFPDVAADLAAELEVAGPDGSEGERSALAHLHGRLAELDPEAAGRIHSTNRRRILRALEVTLGSGRPFSSFGPGLERYPPTSVSSGRDPARSPRARRSDRRPIPPADGGRLPRRGPPPGVPAGRPVPHRPPGPRLSRAPGPCGGRRPAGRRRGGGGATHQGLRPPPDGMVPSRSPYRVGRPGRRSGGVGGGPLRRRFPEDRTGVGD